MSSAKDLGTRHVCWKCEAKFYDLNKPSPACPKCGADPREAPSLKVVKPPKAAPAPAVKKVVRSSDEDDQDDDLESFDDLEEDDDEDDESGGVGELY